MKKQTIFIVSIIALALAAGIWREHYYRDHYTAHAVSDLTLHLGTGTALSPPIRLPAFDLEDMEGQPFTLDSLKKHWSFVFFGYTQCPDICPATLHALQDVSQRLVTLPSVQYIFITIDPQHDTPAQLKEYMSRFSTASKHFNGVTGNMTSIVSFSETMGVHLGISHSSTVFLINPDAEIAAIFTDRQRPQMIAQDVRTLIHHYATHS